MDIKQTLNEIFNSKIFKNKLEEIAEDEAEYTELEEKWGKGNGQILEQKMWGDQFIFKCNNNEYTNFNKDS